MPKKKKDDYQNVGCRHPHCKLWPNHPLPHENVAGCKWSGFTCVDPNCGSFQKPDWQEDEFLRGTVDPEKYPDAKWTPCCRNTRWWNPDGSLGGNLFLDLFCEDCKDYVTRTLAEPILAGKVKAPRAVHWQCVEKEVMAKELKKKSGRKKVQRK